MYVLACFNQITLFHVHVNAGVYTLTEMFKLLLNTVHSVQQGLVSVAQLLNSSFIF